MVKKHLAGLLPALAVVALAVLPAIAQAHNIKINGKKIGTTKEPVLSYGELELKNKTLHNFKCQNFVAGDAWNETTEGTEKAFEETVGFTTYNCAAEISCEVKNTKGEEVPGYFASAEGPATATGKKTGVSSLPWSGEITEKEGSLGVLTHNVKVWVVLAPVGIGLGCLGTEYLYEDKTSGATEKPAINELFPLAIDGAKSGLHPSHGELRGEEGLEESEGKVIKGARTGRLESSLGPAYTAGTLWVTGAKHEGAAFELVTAE
jgi:hypothetical protein